MKTIMKNLFIKITLFVVIMIGCNGARGQAGSIAFSNDGVTWVHGQSQSKFNFKQADISAIGGDTLWMKNIVNGFEENADWMVSIQTYTLLQSDTNKSVIFFIMPDTLITNLAVTTHTPNTYPTLMDYGAALDESMFWTKFVYQKNPSISDSIYDDTLTISQFNKNFCDEVSPNSYSKIDSVYWYKDGVLLSTTSDTSLAINGDGDYYIEILFSVVLEQDSTLCTYVRKTEQSNVISVVITNLNCANLYENTFKIYPNPVETILYISEEIDYSIFSITGQMVISGRGKEIDVSYFPVGVYMLRYKTQDDSLPKEIRFGKQ